MYLTVFTHIGRAGRLGGEAGGGARGAGGADPCVNIVQCTRSLLSYGFHIYFTPDCYNYFATIENPGMVPGLMK